MIKEKVIIAVLSVIVLGISIFGTMYYFTDIRPILNGENVTTEPPLTTTAPQVNENLIYDTVGNEYLFSVELDENNIYHYLVTDVHMNQIISGMLPFSEDLGEINKERFNIQIENIPSTNDTTQYLSVQYLEPAVGSDTYYNTIISIVLDAATPLIEIGQGGKIYTEGIGGAEVPLAVWDTDAFYLYYTAGCISKIDQEAGLSIGNIYYLKILLDGQDFTTQVEEMTINNIYGSGGSC